MLLGPARVQWNSRTVTKVTQGRDQPGYSLLPGLCSPPAWSSLPLPCVSNAGSSAAPRRCDIVPGPEERPRGPVKPHVSGELASSPDTLLHTSALGLTLGRIHPPHRHQECPAQPSPVQAWLPSRLLQASSLLLWEFPCERSLGLAA